MLEKIVSGGQTGVDRAALDAALECGFPLGGWCPKDRRAEDGRIANRYPLAETPKRRYQERTRWNVRDSDGTLILAAGDLTGGTLLTARLAEQFQKPLFHVDLSEPIPVEDLLAQLAAKQIRVLNIAGPRESTEPGVYARSFDFVARLIRAAKAKTAKAGG